MREIKFRLWDKENEEMYYQLYSTPSFGQSENDRLVSLEDALFYEKHAFEIMQSTGLHDKNGTEIYEGDVVTAFSNINKISEPHLTSTIEPEYEKYWIIFDRGAFKLRNKKYSSCGILDHNTSSMTKDLEVIGNIYENPELAEKEATHE